MESEIMKIQIYRFISCFDDFRMGTDHEFHTAALNREKCSHRRQQVCLLREDGLTRKSRQQRACTTLHARLCSVERRQGCRILLLWQRHCFLLPG